MYKRDRIERNKISYKIKMWFYKLTWNDIKIGIKNVLPILNDFILVLIGLIILFFFPALFH